MVVDFHLGDALTLRKAHPCGGTARLVAAGMLSGLTTARRGPTKRTPVQARPRRCITRRPSSGLESLGRRIPLDSDSVLELSIRQAPALGLIGLTNAQGRARANFVIPNLPSIVGLTLFCAAVTLDATRPEGIDNISNEIAITFRR